MVNGLLIASLCSGVAATNSPACKSASEAFIRHYGIYQDVDLMEVYVQNKAIQNTPFFVQKTISYTLITKSFLSGKEIKVDFKIPNLCDKMELGASVNSGSFNLKWIF